MVALGLALVAGSGRAAPSIVTAWLDVAPLGEVGVEDDGDHDAHVQVGGTASLVLRAPKGVLFGVAFGYWYGDRRGTIGRDYTMLAASLGFGYESRLVRFMVTWDLGRCDDNEPTGDGIDTRGGDPLYVPRLELALGPPEAHAILAGAANLTPHTRRFLAAGFGTRSVGGGLAWVGRAVPNRDGATLESLAADDWTSLAVWGEGRVSLGMTHLVMRADASLSMVGLSVGVEAPL